jgi:hypothetical protein
MEPINPFGNFGNRLKSKFPMPQSSREKAVFVMIAGLATMFAASFDPVQDAYALATSAKAPGVLATHGPKTGVIETKQIGMYVFTDSDGVRRFAPSRRTRKFIDDVPPALTVVWPQGRSELARAIGEYWHQVPVAGFGLMLTLLGLWFYRRGGQKG